MLVQLAMIVLAFCAMLSLIIDVGYARITQAQMQNAVDTAAIEGVRQRDAGTDAARRTAAAALVSNTFDDDFDVADGDPDQYGAGPIIDLTDGLTTLHGAQTATVPDQHSYKPLLQSNLENATEGDMVGGQFCYDADPAPPEGSAYELAETVCGAPQRGIGSYSRDDFNPGGANQDAFLVRLRRSNDFQDQAAQTEEDVASSGPPLPLTFGKATTIFSDDPSGGYSVRRDGLTVRATGIGQARPVVHLGLPQAGQPALAAFDLIDACARSANGVQVTIPVSINPTTGVMTRTNAPGAPPTCAANTVVGRIIANPAAPVPAAMSTGIRTIGATPPAANVATTCQAVPQNLPARYVAVYSVMAAGPNRIVGFAAASLARQANCPGAGRGGAPVAYAATITRAASTVARANATALFVGGLPAGVPPALVPELLDKNLVRNGAANYGPVLAPVLAR